MITKRRIKELAAEASTLDGIGAAPYKEVVRAIERALEESAALPASDPERVSVPVAWIEHHKGGDNLQWGKSSLPCTPLYAAPQAKAEPESAVKAPQCKGKFWFSMQQGPQWVCECCTEHDCKDGFEHCHRFPTQPESAAKGGE